MAARRGVRGGIRPAGSARPRQAHLAGELLAHQCSTTDDWNHLRVWTRELEDEETGSGGSAFLTRSFHVRRQLSTASHGQVAFVVAMAMATAMYVFAVKGWLT